MGKLNRSQFKFRKYDTIGAEGAEADADFLLNCFVDNGALSILRDPNSTPCVLVGRTGTGKTALLSYLQESSELVCRIEPHELSLEFLANSTILRYLEGNGINLDLFYRLLWRHVLVVELIQLRYHLHSQSDQDNFLARIKERFFGDKKKTAALDYLVKWGQRFWEDTELRVHEIIKKLEEDVKAELGSRLSLLDASARAAQSTSVEDRQEIVHRAQEIVNSLQIAQLTQIIKVLSEDVFDDSQKHYFVIIDGLDENWVSDPLRYRLIRSLIEAVRDLRQVRSAKILVAIRRDLLDRVFRYTRDSGFQEEKYQAYLLPVQWTDAQLLELLDKRLNKLVQRQYTGAAVSWADIFPKEVNHEPTEKFLLARTHRRPRDVIQFVNCCIALAADRPAITAAIVRDAEAEYSRLRMRSLADEWFADYPHLLDTIRLLHGRPESFAWGAVTDEELQTIAFRLVDFPAASGDRLQPLAVDLLEGRIDMEEFRRRLIGIYHEVGLVGIRTDAGSGVSWGFNPRDRLDAADIGMQSRLIVCPMFWRALSIRPVGGAIRREE